MQITARSLCQRALLEWEKGRIFSDEILHGIVEKHPLANSDRGLLTELFYGVLRHQRRLDFLIGRLREAELDVQTRNLLRVVWPVWRWTQHFFLRLCERDFLSVC